MNAGNKSAVFLLAIGVVAVTALVSCSSPPDNDSPSQHSDGSFHVGDQNKSVFARNEAAAEQAKEQRKLDKKKDLASTVKEPESALTREILEPQTLLPTTKSAKADYTVKGDKGTYVKKDSRIYFDAPVFTKNDKDGIHDPNNEAVKTLQDPEISMKEFPFDRRGGINWVKAIDQGDITPRMTLTGEEHMNVMDMDIMLKNTGEMPWVRFPHLAHTRWLDCSNCHPAIFIPQRGANKIGMDAILGGQYCGRCHDKVAFPLWTCERCHSVPHENSPAAWWRDKDKPFPPTKEAIEVMKQNKQITDSTKF